MQTQDQCCIFLTNFPTLWFCRQKKNSKQTNKTNQDVKELFPHGIKLLCKARGLEKNKEWIIVHIVVWQSILLFTYLTPAQPECWLLRVLSWVLMCGRLAPNQLARYSLKTLTGSTEYSSLFLQLQFSQILRCYHRSRASNGTGQCLWWWIIAPCLSFSKFACLSSYMMCSKSTPHIWPAC